MLNAHYVALRIISARRAFSLLFKSSQNNHPIAEVVHFEDGRYNSYDFNGWQELSELCRENEAGKFDWVRSVRFEVAVPRVIRVLTYHKLTRQKVRLNRRTILARDRNRCQYCGRQFPASKLSLDHVVPRSLNGPQTWENIVCCCLRCNVKKGGRTPERAGMRLIAKPGKPAQGPVLSAGVIAGKYAIWRHFLDQVHWNPETQ